MGDKMSNTDEQITITDNELNELYDYRMEKWAFDLWESLTDVLTALGIGRKDDIARIMDKAQNILNQINDDVFCIGVDDDGDDGEERAT